MASYKNRVGKRLFSFSDIFSSVLTEQLEQRIVPDYVLGDFGWAASIYQAMGLPQSIAWKDALDRPHFVYHADPIRGLV
jgi:hypothetical protein